MTSKECAICDAAEAKTPCENCFAVFYCSKEHQKEDRSKHKSKCKPYKIEFSDKMGRFMTSARDIRPGEVILKEFPVVVGPTVNSPILCLGCHRTIGNEKYRVCSNCGVAPMCSPECELKPFHADRECHFYQEKLKNDNGTFLSSNFQVVTPLRCLMLKETDLWESFINLESHLEERQNHALWRFYQEQTCNVLKAMNIVSLDDQMLIQKICAILDINSYESRHPQLEIYGQLRAIYLEAALMSHNCISNTHLSVDNNFHMTVRASVPIRKEEPIFCNYTNPLGTTSQRHKCLQEGKHFTCTCKRCCDPTELGTYMGSIICSRCQIGLVIPTNPLSQESDWYCNNCKHRFLERLINTTIRQGLNLIEANTTSDYRKLELLLKKLLKTFPKTSVVVVDLKSKMALCLEKLILNTASPTKIMLELTRDLFADLLEVLNIVEPGISRAKGITLHKLCRAKLALANKEFCSMEIQKEQFLNQLKECQKILKEAISILIYEAPNSPEGALTQTAFHELKIIQYYIKNGTNSWFMPDLLNVVKRMNLNQ